MVFATLVRWVVPAAASDAGIAALRIEYGIVRTVITAAELFT
ncbi:hypothetical protein [Actinoplanes ianthinogenes]|nr:hypothetical protein [Actinoplanes ianthinogenes]